MSEVVLDFKVQAQQANASLNKLNNSVKSVGKSVTTARLAFANIVSNAATSAIKGSLTIISNGIGSIINKTIELEKISTQFEVLTGSVDGAKTVMKDLQQFAATTPFQLPGLAATGAQLLAFGFTADELIPKMQVLGDIAAAAGKPIGEIGLIFGQVAAAGKLTGERLLQLQERGIPIGAALADSLGVAETAVKDLVSTGQVSFTDFEKAMESMNKAGGFAFEGMIKQSKTLGGILSTLGDNFDLLQTEIGEKFLPAFKLVALEMIKLVQENRDTIVAWVKQGVVLAIEALVNFLPYLNGTISAFKLMGDTLILTKDAIMTGFWAIETVIAGVILGIVTNIEGLIHALPDRFIPDSWKENLAITKDALTETTLEMANNTAEAAERMAENFNNVSESFEATVDEEGLNKIKSVLNATKKAVIDTDKEINTSKKKARKDDLKNAKSYYGGLAGFVGKFKSFEESSQKERVENMKSTLGNIGSLTSSSNKTLFRIGQAASISTATIDGISGVQKALASAPPPFNFALAALVGTAAAANVAKIVSTKPPKFANGGVVPGTSTFGDQVPAFLNSEEVVLNGRQQANALFQIANGRGGSDGNADVVSAIGTLGDRIANMEVVLQTSDYEIGRSVNRAADDGLVIRNAS